MNGDMIMRQEKHFSVTILLGFATACILGGAAGVKAAGGCNGGTCSISEKECDLGSAPAQSVYCEPGTKCRTRGNSCWGLPGLQVPRSGSVGCEPCSVPGAVPVAMP